MGKKRIKDMGVQEEPKKASAKGRKIVKTGKEHGRITDMGAVALAEAERIKEKEKELEKRVTAETRKQATAKTPKKQKRKRRGKRYLQAKKQVDRSKFYSLPKAIKLLKKTSISRFNGTVEVHLIVREKELRREIKLPHSVDKQAKLTMATEKKAPLVHLAIGKVDTKESNLAENFQAIVKAIGPKSIKKAVLTSTMGPGIKVDLGSL